MSKLSEETRKKISLSLKAYHEIKTAPPLIEQKIALAKDYFKIGSGQEVTVRNYGDFGQEELIAQTRNTTQDSAEQEIDNGTV